MRVAAVSDLHGNLPDVPECDLLLVGGDICPLGDHGPLAQLKFLNGFFREWLHSLPAKKIVGVAGNHDFIFERAPHMVPTDLPWTYLQDGGTVIDGLNVWGSPWQPVFYHWAFNAEDNDRERRWAAIPDDTHVLVLHGPPHGYGDLTRGYKGAPGGHVGCERLLRRIDSLPELKLCVFGHIHSGYGRYIRGGATLANVSLVNERYVPTNMVQTFDL